MSALLRTGELAKRLKITPHLLWHRAKSRGVKPERMDGWAAYWSASVVPLLRAVPSGHGGKVAVARIRERISGGRKSR